MVQKILCFGTHILDTIALPVDRIPQGQNTTLMEHILHGPAGTAAGVAVDIAHLGFSVSTLGAIGDDAAGRLLYDMMSTSGVDTGGLKVKSYGHTASSVLLVDSLGNRPALHSRGVNSNVEWNEFPTTDFADADIVHFGGCDALPGLEVDETLRRIRLLRERGAIVTMDLQSAAAHLSHQLLDYISEVDAFMPNDEQACGLSRTESVEAAASHFLDRGTKRVLITCGADGIYYADQQGKVLRQPAAPAQVVDTTGCGDSVSAAYIVAQTLGLDIEETLAIAAEAGAAVASGVGSLGDLTTWDELVVRASKNNQYSA